MTIRGVNFNFWQKEAKIKKLHYNGHEENCDDKLSEKLCKDYIKKSYEYNL
jgi:hypothetical protein